MWRSAVPHQSARCAYRPSVPGKINGLAIDKESWPITKQNGVVELQSLNFPKRAQFFVMQCRMKSRVTGLIICVVLQDAGKSTA